MEDSGHPFLDTSQAKNKIWLLSVPKYLGELWKQPECRNKVVGQLKLQSIVKPNGAKDMKVTYILDEKLSNSPPDAKKSKLDSKTQKPAAGSRSGKGIVSGLKVSSFTEPTVGGRTPINLKRGAAGGPAGLTPLGKSSAMDNKLPREHEFTFQEPNDQKLAIISKTKHLEHTEVRKLEGQVGRRAQLKPPRNKVYGSFLKLKDNFSLQKEPEKIFEMFFDKQLKFSSRNQQCVPKFEKRARRSGDFDRIFPKMIFLK